MRAARRNSPIKHKSTCLFNLIADNASQELRQAGGKACEGRGACVRRPPQTCGDRCGRLQMKQFSVGQKWVMTDTVYGQFFGEVIEISVEGRVGTVVITDDRE